MSWTDTPTLACGCRRGFHLCDTAVKLWTTTWATPYDQPDEYQRAYNDYEEHFNE